MALVSVRAMSGGLRREADSEEGVVLDLHCLFLETLKIKTWFKVQQIMFIERKENHSVI